jgi:hypothetical protein
MTYIAVILLIALVASFAVFLSGRGLARDISDVRQIVGRTRPVNIKAFRQLQDRRDQDFLRSRLPMPAFRHTQRLRARAELQYLRDIFHNAALLGRVGDLARETGNAELAAAGTHLLNSAIDVRLRAAVAIVRTTVFLCWPMHSGWDDIVIGKYELVRHQVTTIALMQAPGESSRVAAAI